MRLCIRRLLCVLPAVLLSPAAHGQPAAEYCIIEHVDRLSVLNRYQQQATAAERRGLAPFAPLRILSREFLLSDGYTRSMQVSAGGEELFLVIDGNGGLLRGGQVGVLETFGRAVSLNDTIEILGGAALTITPLTSAPRTLLRGDRLVRFFRQNGRTYCATTGESPRYGWFNGTDASEGATWRKVRHAGIVPASISPSSQQKIRERLAAVNRALASLYAQFNADTDRREQPPRWELSEDAGGLRCMLTGAPPGDRFRESTGYLARDIETIVLGSGVRVTPGAGIIDVRVPEP